MQLTYGHFAKQSVEFKLTFDAKTSCCCVLTATIVYPLPMTILYSQTELWTWSPNTPNFRIHSVLQAEGTYAWSCLNMWYWGLSRKICSPSHFARNVLIFTTWLITPTNQILRRIQSIFLPTLSSNLTGKGDTDGSLSPISWIFEVPSTFSLKKSEMEIVIVKYGKHSTRHSSILTWSAAWLNSDKWWIVRWDALHIQMANDIDKSNSIQYWPVRNEH